MIGLSTNQKTNKTRHDRKKTGLECGTKCDFVSELTSCPKHSPSKVRKYEDPFSAISTPHVFDWLRAFL